MGINCLLRHMEAGTIHDDLAKERLKMSRESEPIDELFKKDATLETQKDKSLIIKTVQSSSDRNVSSRASASSLHASKSHESRACQLSSSSLSKYVTNEEVQTAEILWSIKKVDANFSFRSCDGLGYLFAHMFPDNEIAKNSKCREQNFAT